MNPSFGHFKQTELTGKMHGHRDGSLERGSFPPFAFDLDFLWMGLSSQRVVLEQYRDPFHRDHRLLDVELADLLTKENRAAAAMS